MVGQFGLAFDSFLRVTLPSIWHPKIVGCRRAVCQTHVEPMPRFPMPAISCWFCVRFGLGTVGLVLDVVYSRVVCLISSFLVLAARVKHLKYGCCRYSA